MRYVAIDLGDRRTGLAVGDDETGAAMPLAVVDVPIDRRGGEELLDVLAKAIDGQVGVRGELVFGLPVNMDGTEGPRAKSVRAFAERLGKRTGLVVHVQDERLSSAAADWTMARSGLTRGQKKERRDALAAAEILKGFLAARGDDRAAPGAGG